MPLYTERDPLAPDESNIMGLAGAATSIALMYTPLGSKLIGGALKLGMGAGIAGTRAAAWATKGGLKAAWKGSWSAAKLAGRSGRQAFRSSLTENLSFGRPGLPADNLGATGDLTLALHNRR